MEHGILSAKINEVQENIVDDVRDYIGASSIGYDCLRKIWYQYKGEKSPGVPSKTRRTWAIGKKLEHLVVEWIEDAGIKVDRIEKTYEAAGMPYFQGHFDGTFYLDGVKHILEVKTAKDASFKVFQKKGLAAWDLGYYSQVQAYMGMSGIHRAIIIVLNKDNSDISDELVLYDAVFYESLLEKARLIRGAHVPPPRINGSPLFFKCKMCKYANVCHE